MPSPGDDILLGVNYDPNQIVSHLHVGFELLHGAEEKERKNERVEHDSTACREK